MNGAGAAGVAVWSDALHALCLVALDPAGLGGVCLRAHAGPVREAWLGVLRETLPRATSLRRVPVHATEGRLLGGLDLAATLGSGRPVAERGLLAEADGGLVLLPSVERMPRGTLAHVTGAMDRGVVLLERDGITGRLPARFGVIALDEGIEGEERPARALTDRLALHLDLRALSYRDALETLACCTPSAISAARRRLNDVVADETIVEALCTAAVALGIGSFRPSLLVVRAARGLAALAGRSKVGEADAALAARLVLAPRATQLPLSEEEDPTENQTAEEESPSKDDDGSGEGEGADGPLADQVLEAVKAALPAALLAALGAADRERRSGAAGKAGSLQNSRLRGRPAGVRRGELRSGQRLNVVETLRAAAPWQRLRRGDDGAATEHGGRPGRVEVRREDFRVTRYRHRSETTTIFVVDASGSSAMHRLAEAKGAVELLLADCYVRRDRVALIAFRGPGAELLLPPTRSLVRAKRSLARLPGGGGTPLAAGIECAMAIADAAGRRGETPLVVMLTDGRANITREGIGGRERAREDALAAARRLRVLGHRTILIDTSPRARPDARELADAMLARYLPLPHADAAALSTAVRREAAVNGAGSDAAA